MAADQPQEARSAAKDRAVTSRYRWCGRCGKEYDGVTPHGPGKCEKKASVGLTFAAKEAESNG